MNKKILLLAFAFLLSNTVPCFASREGWDNILNRLSDSMYGGAYVKEDVLHIKPINTEQVQQIITEFAPNADIILDPPAKYSMAELLKGQNKTDKIWEELKLDYVSISEENNGLSVGSTLEWTAQNKALFIQTTGIENVSFETISKEQTNENMVQQLHRELLPYSSYKATAQKDGNVALEQIIEFYGYTTGYGDMDDVAYGRIEAIPITFEHTPYIKDDFYIMLPLREATGREIAYRELVNAQYNDISEEKMRELIQNEFREIAEHDYSNYNQKSLLKKDEDAKSVTVTFQGNNITFYEGSRIFYINGVNNMRGGLYMPPDITENEVFLCDKDFAMIFSSSVRYTDAEREFFWDFRGITGFPLTVEEKLFIKILTTAKNEETFRVSTQYDGTIFYRRDSNDKEHEKSLDVYEKNNHMMIALQAIPRFRGTSECLETSWDSKTSTATLKIWGGTAKDVVFTKGSNIVLINGTEVEMEEPAEIKENRMYIPINTLFEILDIPEQNIEWIEQGKNVKLTYGKNRNWSVI